MKGPPSANSPGLSEPIPPPLQRLLRHAVLEHGAALRLKRTPTPCLHVGLPGGTHLQHPVQHDQTDHALRTDIVTTMAGSLVPRLHPWAPVVWMTRLGPLTPSEDMDLAWLAAATCAYAELDLTLTYVVVDRHGWHDPRSGVGRQWARLRPRLPAAT